MKAENSSPADLVEGVGDIHLQNPKLRISCCCSLTGSHRMYDLGHCIRNCYTAQQWEQDLGSHLADLLHCHFGGHSPQHLAHHDWSDPAVRLPKRQQGAGEEVGTKQVVRPKSFSKRFQRVKGSCARSKAIHLALPCINAPRKSRVGCFVNSMGDAHSGYNKMSSHGQVYPETG